MKQTVNFYDFRDAFQNLRPDNFSYEGLNLLFEYLEQLEDELGEELELDVIALCCDYREEQPAEIARDYKIDLDGVKDEDMAQAVMDYLCDSTGVVGQTDSGSIIFQIF